MVFNDLNFLDLENIDRNKLYLMWLFHQTNFDELQKKENLTLLSQVWQNVKNDLANYFHNYQLSLDAIIDAFKKIIITTDPKIALQYRPASHKLFSNITELFFSQADIGKNHFASTISWKLGSQLVHEYDHYKIFQNNNLIGNEGEIEQFGKSRGIKIEESAVYRQISFLEHCKKKLPLFINNNLIKVSMWTVSGQPILDEKSSFRQISKVKMVEGITNYISYLRSDLKKNLLQYKAHVQNNNPNQNRILMTTLALYSKNNNRKITYPEIELIL